MKLSTRTIIKLFKALSDLRGAPTVARDGSIVYEPYDMGPKFKWNSSKDRNVLRRHVEAHDEQVMDFQLALRALKKKFAEATDNPAENNRKLVEETDRINEEIRKLSKEEIEVEGLLFLPASGLNIKTTKIPPTVIEELMDLIEGEPDFDEDKSKK